MPDANRQSRPLVSIAGADVCIGGQRILEDIHLVLDADKHCGIVGPNGSGKSTLLGLIAGHLWPAPGSGSREYDFGTGPQSDAVEARRRIAIVSPQLQDHYTRMGWNFTALNVVLSGVTRTDTPRRGGTPQQYAAANAALEAFGAGQFGPRPFLQLSHGEQRRVLIARALCFEPKILILDEPASGLDARARVELDETISKAGQSARVVATAHAQDRLPALITDVVEIERGRIVARHARHARFAKQPRARVSTSHIAQGDKAAVMTAGEAPLIDVRAADVWLGTTHALRQIDWQLNPGHNWLVTGHNGAGKSCFLRLLHAQQRPALGGAISWPGLGNPGNVWALRQKVGWVSPELQAAYLYPSTVRDTVASGFRSSIGMTRPLNKEDEAAAMQLLELFDLAGLRDRPFASLSYGQKRRALIARTLTTRPAVVLLDEPFEGLDAANIELVVSALEHARQRGTQIVCASHLGDGGLALEYELVLDNGCVSSAGPRQS